ncbi:MAG: hypothetical protein ACIARR_08385 [Phycisphaerales bacterium JB059]
MNAPDAMPNPNHDPSSPGPIPDALIDALFDRELSPDARRDVFDAVRHDAHARREIEGAAEALAALRDQPVAPDLTDRILARADARRRFLPKRLRRFTRATRLGASGALLIALLGVAAAQRAWPDRLALAPLDTPLADVNEAFRDDAIQSAQSVRESVEFARGSLASFPQRSAPSGFMVTHELAPSAEARAVFSLAGFRAPAPTVEEGARVVTLSTVFRFEAPEPPRLTVGRTSPSEDSGTSEDLRGVLP